ncbi:MAG: outer membrane beta-barrel protein [Cecembia sp.]
MKSKIYIISILLLIFSTVSYSQTTYLKFNFAPMVPTGNTANFISNTSARSGNIEYYMMSTSRFGFGGEIGFTSLFEKKEGETLTSGTLSITGTQFRYHNLVPIMPAAIYFFNEPGSIRPYVAIGAGFIMNTQRIELGIFQERTSSFQIGIRPELGSIFQLSEYVAIKLSGKYYNTLGGSNLPSQSAIGVNFGFVVTQR